MSEYRNHPDGSITIGPVDTTLRLVEALAKYAEERRYETLGPEECRRLAWFLGSHGETAACEAIMKHAGVQETKWAQTPWGYMPV